MSTLFDLGPSSPSLAERRRPVSPVYTVVEQLPLLPDEHPEFAQQRADLYTIGDCPVDPSKTPCPLVGCSWHCMDLSRCDEGKGTEQLLAELFAMPHTCALHVIREHPEGMTVDELVPIMRLQPQTLRDIERSALMSPIFDDVVRQMEDIVDDDICASERIMLLREALVRSNNAEP